MKYIYYFFLNCSPDFQNESVKYHFQCIVVGNVLGPVINTTIEGGLEKFFVQPTGCGEQTMIYLAPNVYVLEYLKKINQLTEANKANAFRFIQSGTHNFFFYKFMPLKII